MEFDYEGLDELLIEVERMENESERLKKTALDKGGEVLAERWNAEMYSHGINSRTGKAAGSVTHKREKGDVVVGPTSDAFYLYMLEYGFYNVQAKRFIAPRPTGSVVYESSQNAVFDSYVQVFREGLGMT